MLSVQLPQGPSTDSYNIYLLVNIIDDTDGSTLYYLPNPVTVQPDNSLANNLANSITSNNGDNQLLLNLNSGNLNIVAKNVIAITTILNFQSSDSDENSTSSTNDQNVQLAGLREFMVKKFTLLLQKAYFFKY